MKWRIEIENVQNGLARAGEAVQNCIAACGRTAAAQIEAYAKQNRPWTDRTGNARNTLEGVWMQETAAEDSGDALQPRRGAGGEKKVHTLGIVGHMPYSVFLELSYEGKYAILWPTVNALAPEILRRLAECMEGLK